MAEEERLWIELHGLVDSLPPDEVIEPGYFEEGWSAKDLVAHIGSWLAEAGIVLEQIRFGTFRPEEIERIREKLQQSGSFWINEHPSGNESINGYAQQEPVPGVGTVQRIAPAHVDTSTASLLPSDNWPFLYLREPSFAMLYILGLLMVALYALGGTLLLAPRNVELVG